MITFFNQLVLSDHKNGQYGDCARACICTLLQSDPTLWPHSLDSNGEWNDDFFDRLENEGYSLKIRRFKMKHNDLPPIICISGLSIRGINHMVVFNWQMQVVIHDPHPSKVGIIEPMWVYFLESLR